LAGADLYLTRAFFDAAVIAERARISANSFGIYQQGQKISVVGEAPCYRTWFLATGASDATNAANSHARAVVVRPGLTVTLAADANVVFLAAGAPSVGTGANGDISVDYAGNVIYTKSGGTWSVTTSAIFSGAGGSTTVVNNLTSTSVSDALSAAQGKALKDTADALATTVAGKQNSLVSGTSIKTINGTSLLGSGDIVIASSGSTGSTLLVDCSGFSTLTGTNVPNTYTLPNFDNRYVHFTNLPVGCREITVTLPTGGVQGRLISFSSDKSENPSYEIRVNSVFPGYDTIGFPMRPSQMMTLVYSAYYETEQTSASLAWQLFALDHVGLDAFTNGGLTDAADARFPSATNNSFGIAGGIAQSSGALAVGWGAKADSNNCTSIGVKALTRSNYATAIGANTSALFPNSFAMSMGATAAVTAGATGAIALGFNSNNLHTVARTIGSSTSKPVYEFVLRRTGVTTGSELNLTGGTSITTGVAGTTNRFAFPSNGSVYCLLIDVLGRVSGDTAKLYRCRKTCLIHVTTAGAGTIANLVDLITPFQTGFTDTSGNLGVINTTNLSNLVSIGFDATDKALTVTVNQVNSVDGAMAWTAFCEVRRAN
jgi:hypothetical protein